MWKRTAVLLGIALTALAPVAQADDDWVAKWSNGHEIESSDGDFELEFGGRIQADYTFVSEDDELVGVTDGDGFEFRRARLFFEGTIYERVSFKAQYDFAGGDAEFKDVWIALDLDAGKLQFGHFKEHFSLEELTSSKYLAFLERSLPVEAFAPSRNSGVGFSGKKGDKVNWGFGWFYDADDFGASTNEDRTNLTGRIGFRPLYEDGGKRLFHVGLGLSDKETEEDGTMRFRARPGAHFSGRFVDTGNFASDGALVAGLELAGVFDRFWFAGEYIQADVDSSELGDPTFDGSYVQLGYYLTEDHRRFKTSSGGFDRQKPNSRWDSEGGRGAWEIGFRWATLDLSDSGLEGGEMDNYTVGLNWYPNPATRLMINYVLADVDDVGEADFILVRWQVDF